jgi:uncharacterized protein (TIGR02246 family)
MRRITNLVICLVLINGSAMAQQKPSIQKINEEWMAAFNKGDAAGVAALYSEDAYILPNGAEMAKGRRAIETYFKNSVRQLGDAKLKTVDLQSLGPGSAREVGTFNFKTKGDSPQEVVGKYVAVWRKMGGQWKLITDIWNMNK